MARSALELELEPQLRGRRCWVEGCGLVNVLEGWRWRICDWSGLDCCLMQPRTWYWLEGRGRGGPIAHNMRVFLGMSHGDCLGTSVKDLFDANV